MAKKPDHERRSPAAAGSAPGAGSEAPEGLSPALSRLLFVLALLAGTLAAIALPPSAPPRPDTADPAGRDCRIERSEPAVAPETVLFDGVFAPLPPDATAEMRRWVEVFQGPFADTFRVYLRRARRWEARVAPILDRHGVPEDFLYLAVIESGFNPEAHSPLHAVGVWQFRRYTARHEGLRISWNVDDRRDPVAATEATARHLRRLYRGFDDWTLATAAYNAGPGRVLRALWRADYDADFWELARRRLLPSQTRSYVPKLLAAAHVAHDPGGTGFGFVPLPEPGTARVRGRLPGGLGRRESAVAAGRVPPRPDLPEPRFLLSSGPTHSYVAIRPPAWWHEVA